MTCVVAIVDGTGIWMGADSAVIDHDTFSVRTIREPKVRRIGGLLIGAAGELRAGQVVAQFFKPPKPSKRAGRIDASEYAFACADAMRALLVERGAGQKSKEQDKHEAVFLLGYARRLFVIEEDYDVHEPHESYAAIGAGADLALGALYSRDVGDPQARIVVALEAAERFNASVRGPFTILRMP
jgi:ATP-dependent protease HslVU (ClpYQ) peptidase subunit